MRLTEKTREYYLGAVDRCYLGYSSDREIRSHCASGGIVSAILIALLESRQVDGVMVYQMYLAEGEIKGRSFIATSRDEILSSGGSVYFNIEPLSYENLMKFSGRLAVVGLPCHLKRLETVLSKHSELSDKIALKLGLFCGHNSSKTLLLKVLEKKHIKVEEIEKLFFRKGRWRGNMQIHMKSGDMVEFPFSHFSLYQNLHLFSLKKCLYCNDHTAEKSDISCGDAWLKKMKKEDIKHSIFFSRNQKGNDVLNSLIKKGAVLVKDSSPEEVFLSQKRSIIHHKSLYARSRLSRFFGYDIKYSDRGDTRWNDYLAAMISLANVRCSENSSFQKVIFRIPRPVLHLYLLVFKFLTNF
jgi:coenzyme F420-reducing hydrogenase beta subunit